MIGSFTTIDGFDDLSYFFKMAYAALHQENFSEIVGDISTSSWINRVVKRSISLDTPSKIEETFQKAVRLLTSLLRLYADSIQILSQGGKLDSSFQTIRNEISDAYQLMGTWIKVFNQFYQNPRLIYPPHPYLVNNLELFATYFPSPPFKIMEEEGIVSSFCHYHSIIALENHYRAPLPMHLFKVFSRTEETIAEIHYKSLRRFIGVMKSVEKECKETDLVRDFHKGLLGICYHINTFEPNQRLVNVSILEARIAKLWKIFETVDSVHLAKAAWLENQSLWHYGEILEIGSEIPGNQISHYHRVFNIENRTDVVLRIYPNKGASELPLYLKSPLAVTSPKIIDFSPIKGRYVLMEKVIAYKWKSHSRELTKKDKEDAQLLIDYIQSFLKLPEQLVPWISFNNLAVNQEGKLCALKIDLGTYVTIPKLEELVFEFASGSLTMYQYVLEQTKLEIKQLFIYQTAIKAAIRKTSWPPTSSLDVKQFGEAIFNHAQKVYEDVKELERLCVDRLTELGLEIKVEELLQMIEKVMKETRCHMRIWPTVLEDVIILLTRNL